MCKKLIYLVSIVLFMGSVSHGEDIQWTGLGGDNLWSTPENWDLGRIPTLEDEVRIDVPAAAAPNGPVIQDGIDAKAKGIFTEAAGEPMLTITGGTLEVAEWIWWGDGADSFAIMDMSGGTLTTGSEFELGWGGGAGTLTMTGGTISAFEGVIPTGSGAFGDLFLYGGTYNVTKAGGLEVNSTGMIDITEGTLVLEGDDTVKVNDLIAAGLITAYGGNGKFELDFDGRNPGKTTLTAVRVPAMGPIRVDVGNSHNAEELEAGFTSFTLDDSGSDVDGITIEFSGINAGDARRRGEPAGVPYENIYRDFIFGRQSEAGVGYVSVKLSGLMANKTYSITLYSWDVSSTNIRIADWTANGEPLFTTIHDGNVDPPAAEGDYAYTAAATADADGVILMEAVPGEGTFAAEPFAFINALEVELQRVSLFAENFEGLTLGPNVDETLAGDAVWTETPPEGWSIDESGIPGIGMDATDGVTEWAGWAFTDKEWWTQAAEDQDRSMFELGSGIVAVADPDEWDDAERLPIPISADPYDTWLTTPAIDIADAEAGTLVLKFDSSWRPEFDDNYHQTANITASFDGGDPVEVMLWESDEASDNYHPYATNETVTVKLDNPEGARKLVLTFGLFDAGNDWWWAIDNIEVLGVVPELGPIKPSTEGLLAYYALDGDPNDSSGNGIDGIIYNAETGGLGDGGSVWVDDPERGTVISFNGTASSAYVRAGEIPQMTLTNDFTWAFWAKQKAENTANNDIIFGNRMDENAVDFVPRQFIKFTPTKFEWHMNGNGDDNMEYDDIPADVWLHHAVVKTADQLTYYRNGIVAGSGTITQPLDVPQPLFFGGDNEGSEGENWNGLMSDACIYDRALSAGEVMFLAGFQPGPVAHYKLDDGEGIIVVDSSGNGNDGIITTNPDFVDPTWITGILGGALEFYGDTSVYGSANHVQCAHSDSLDVTGPISIALWIRPDTDDPEGQGLETAPMAKALSGASPSWSWQVRYGWGSPQPYMAFTFNTSPRAWAYVGRNLERGVWTHIACSHDGETLKCYLNGEETDSTPMGAITSSPTPVLIGSDGWGCDWIGAIDDVRIYDRALSEAEIGDLVNN